MKRLLNIDLCLVCLSGCQVAEGDGLTFSGSKLHAFVYFPILHLPQNLPVNVPVATYRATYNSATASMIALPA